MRRSPLEANLALGSERSSGLDAPLSLYVKRVAAERGGFEPPTPRLLAKRSSQAEARCNRSLCHLSKMPPLLPSSRTHKNHLCLLEVKLRSAVRVSENEPSRKLGE